MIFFDFRWFSLIFNPRPILFKGGKFFLPAWFFENHYSIAIFLPTTTIQNQKSVSKVGLIILKLQFSRSWWPKTKKIQAFLTFLTLHFDFDHRIPDQYYCAIEIFFSQHDSLEIIIQSLFFFPQPPYRIKNQYLKWG